MKRPHSPAAEPADEAERWTVDALEDSPHGPLARLERPDGTTFTLPLHDLPAGLQEGDVLAVQDGPDGVVAHRLNVEALKNERQAELTALNAGGEAKLPTNQKGEITL